ncbi:MAG: flagellar FlbD family protein [Alicyclobacillus sp.]|nr:flagellar FlbD family protein [Alicyclobacillus sp.]
MIQVTRINGKTLWLNPLLVETLEATPDTIITLHNGHKYIVRESPEEVAEQMAAYFVRIGLVAAEGRKESPM